MTVMRLRFYKPVFSLIYNIQWSKYSEFTSFQNDTACCGLGHDFLTICDTFMRLFLNVKSAQYVLC